MVSFKRSEIEHNRALRVIKNGGYLVLLGIFVGITLGVYTLFTPPLFSVFIDISYYEARVFFLGVYLPSFITIIAIGYVFATIPRLERLNIWRTAALCSIALLCIALSALAIFSIFSFLGGIIILAAIIFNHAQPTFKVLWRREACFFVEIGTILTTSSLLLFLLMHLISGFLQTYSSGVYEASYSYPYLLLVMAVLSFLTFLAVPFLCLHGANVGLCGIIGLTMGILVSVMLFQEQYMYFNLSVFQGIFLAGIGIASTFLGALIHFKLFFSEFLLSPALEPSVLYKGKYCPYCGKSWADVNRVLCSTCGQNLLSKLEKSFCPYCGRLVLPSIKNCPHCGEFVESLPVYISPMKREMLVKKPEKLQKAVNFLLKPFGRMVERKKKSILTLKEVVYICILSFLFVFLSFILYIRVFPAGWDEGLELFRLYYGFPIEWLEVETTFAYVLSVRIIGIPLLLDFILYFALAFVIVYGSKKLYNLI